MTTIIFIQPLLTGKSTIKSIKMSFYLQSGAGSGFNRLLYFIQSFGLSADIATKDISSYYIIYIRPVIFLLE